MYKTSEHARFFFFLKNKELTELYITLTLRDFAIGMLALFLPVYLYTLNHSVIEIFLFYIIFYIFSVVFFFVGNYSCRKIGVKHTILVSAPVTLISLLVMLTLDDYLWPLWFLALTYGAGAGLFWSGFHLYFSEKSDKGNRGKEVGILNGTVAIFNSFAPLAGALLASLISFKVMFIVSGAVLLLSVIPLFVSSEEKSNISIKLSSLIAKGEFKRNIAYIGEGIRFSALGIFWPFYIFISGLSIITLGFSSTLANLFYVVFNFVMAAVTDADNKVRLIRIGALLHSISIFVRGFVTAPLSILFVYSYGGITSPMLDVPFTAQFYDNSSKSKGQSIIFREFYLLIGRIFIFGLAILIFLITNDLSLVFITVFILAGLSCYLFTFNPSRDK